MCRPACPNKQIVHRQPRSLAARRVDLPSPPYLAFFTVKHRSRSYEQHMFMPKSYRSAIVSKKAWSCIYLYDFLTHQGMAGFLRYSSGGFKKSFGFLLWPWNGPEESFLHMSSLLAVPSAFTVSLELSFFVVVVSWPKDMPCYAIICRVTKFTTNFILWSWHQKRL